MPENYQYLQCKKQESGIYNGQAVAKLSKEVIKRTSISENENVEKNMNKLLKWYKCFKKVTINEIIEFHAKFEKVHPFQAGNGCGCRIIAFKECLRNNIVPFIILDKENFSIIED